MSASGRTDVLIVGGGIAGVTAAETTRRLVPERSVTLVDHEDHPLYSRVLLRHYVSGKIPREKVFLRTPEQYTSRGIRHLPGVRVDSLDVDTQEARLSNRSTLTYERVLLATGGYPRPWSVPGSELPGVLRFQTVEDADRLRAACASATQAVVVGGGFIGMDFVAAFVHAGIPTTVLVREPYYWARFLDPESGALIGDRLRESGVTVRFGVTVERVVGSGVVEGIVTSDGGQYPADAVGVGIGIAPDTGFLRGSGIRFGNGIAVNEFLETDRPEVLAAGDGAEFLDTTVGARHRLGNWTNAVGHGLAVGRTLAGQRTAYRAVSAYSITYLGLPIAFVGDTHPHPENVSVLRGSRASGSLGRILLRGGRVVGATLLNRATERLALQSLIRDGVEVGRRTDALADPGFPLASFLP